MIADGEAAKSPRVGHAHSALHRQELQVFAVRRILHLADLHLQTHEDDAFQQTDQGNDAFQQAGEGNGAFQQAELGNDGFQQAGQVNDTFKQVEQGNDAFQQTPIIIRSNKWAMVMICSYKRT